ncbi:MAG: DUF2239 family protein [Bryobacteraceae bacterium]
MEHNKTYTSFAGETLIGSGPLEEMLPKVKRWVDQSENPMVLIFEDQTGRQVDFDLQGPLDEVMVRALPARQRAGPGRPKLGVVSREVTLLPRHWTWLEQQPNGASAALRRLVDQARSHDPGQQRSRMAMDAACRFMSALAGDLPGYEEATRALYAGKGEQFEALIQGWPHDIRTYVQKIAHDAFQEVGSSV